jgi:hypothetical protein
MVVPKGTCELCGREHPPNRFHSRCHPAHPVWVDANDTGAIIMSCSICQKEVFRLTLGLEVTH